MPFSHLEIVCLDVFKCSPNSSCDNPLHFLKSNNLSLNFNSNPSFLKIVDTTITLILTSPPSIVIYNLSIFLTITYFPPKKRDFISEISFS